MLAEIFFLRLETVLRNDTAGPRLPVSETRFVPVELPRKK